MSWLPKNDKLDETQRKAIELALEDGNYFVCGEAGTGKSVVLVHLALQYKALHPKAKICALTYTNALVACLSEALTPAKIPVMTFHKFMGAGDERKYDLVVIDEAQDLRSVWAATIQSRGLKFVLAGDFNQMLYGETESVLSQAELMEVFQIRASLMLAVDYRLPKSQRMLVHGLYPDRQFHSRINNTMRNAKIQLYHAKNPDEELRYVINYVEGMSAATRPSAILFERKKSIFRFIYTLLPELEGAAINLETINDTLRERGVPFRFLGNGIGDLTESDSLALTYLMTWHSSKGLDFETVVVPNLGRGKCKCRCNPFYVAMTRARENMVLTYTGGPSDQIEKAKACESVTPIAADKETVFIQQTLL